ncbi:MAG: hypothetical protein A2W31_02835 [Planctomycetes bacterium RBG_16_64_10]|nr:MAG: hypothetical protein A2W31_02835 [Planctomycetes bacterium RBG_16_64_10]
MTNDPLVINSLQQRIAQTGRRASELLRTLAASRLALVERIHQRLNLGAAGASAQNALRSATASLHQSGLLHTGADYPRAYAAARLASNTLGQVQRIHFEHVVRGWGLPVSSPLTVGYATLPEQILFAGQLRASRLGPNQLMGGDFEDLAAMRRGGWQHYRHPVAGLQTTVELTPQEPHSGRFSLRLRATAVDAQAAPPRLVTPPVWVTSPPVPVPAGQLVRIHGWVRVTQLKTGQVDDLLVIDSLAGEALAARIGPSDGWRDLTLYRVAPQSQPATVTFALSGYGQAEVDGVTIAPVEWPAARGPAPISSSRDPFRTPVVR